MLMPLYAIIFIMVFYIVITRVCDDGDTLLEAFLTALFYTTIVGVVLFFVGVVDQSVTGRVIEGFNAWIDAQNF